MLDQKDLNVNKEITETINLPIKGFIRLMKEYKIRKGVYSIMPKKHEINGNIYIFYLLASWK